MAPSPSFDSLKFEDQSFSTTQFQQKSNFSYKVDAPISHRPSMEDLRVAAASRETRQSEPESSDGMGSDDSSSATTQQEASAGYWSSLQVIGQVDLTYIVTQAQDKMILVDQHAAHERVAFERLMQAWRGGDLEIQHMLLPITIDLEESEVEALLTVQEDILKMGVQIEREGPASLAISSLPSIIKEKGIVEALKKLAFEINDKGGSFALETTIGDIFATMACHSVIRAGQALSREEMQSLLQQMDEFPLSGFCPHGRSVALEFSFTQLEKDFGRRV